MKFILSIIYSKFQEMPKYENSKKCQNMKIPTPGKFQKNTIINSKRAKILDK
jgi:hypothetical protein